MIFFHNRYYRRMEFISIKELKIVIEYQALLRIEVEILVKQMIIHLLSNKVLYAPRPSMVWAAY